jgi:hypothetical protein
LNSESTVEPIQQNFSHRLFDALTDTECEQFTELLGRLNRRLRELEAAW